MVDTGGHGINPDKANSSTGVPADQLTRADVSVTGATPGTPAGTATACVVTG